MFWAKGRWGERREQLRCVGKVTRQDWLGHSCGHLSSLALKSSKKLRRVEAVDKLEIQMGIQLSNTPNLGSMTPSQLPLILRLTGDPGEHERIQEEIWKWVQNESHSVSPFSQLSPRIPGVETSESFIFFI